MTLVDSDFWENPPWGKGEKKYRLGLAPIDEGEWLNRKPDKDLLNYKKDLLSSNYSNVIAVTDDSINAQNYLGDIFGISNSKYPDLIAELSLNIQDDLCLLESKNEQRLLAASICSPSYWDLRTKIGRPLTEIHEPVTSLDSKIGNRISTFIRQSPVMKPFARQNWLIHGDVNRFHLKEEEFLKSHPSKWFIRSEKETLCRFHEEYFLFTINVLFQPLKIIFNYPEQRRNLILSIKALDKDESDYFGGRRKINILLEYLERQV